MVHDLERSMLDALSRPMSRGGLGHPVGPLRIWDLARPAQGAIVGRFGVYTDRVLGVSMERTGLEIRTRPQQRILAMATGRVVWMGTLPGLDTVVVLEHEHGLSSLTGRLGDVAVELGARVERGATLGHSGVKAVDDGLGDTVYIELRHGERPIDPSPYLEP
jgi:septal ring factor EnvC (AmiA/AmiB activator)